VARRLLRRFANAPVRAQARLDLARGDG
jgi:hypothetical protein